MFGAVSKKFQDLFTTLAGSKKLTEENISDAVREVRLALLEADVEYSVASLFVKRVKEKALGAEITKKVSSSDQFIKIVHDELKALMGGEEEGLSFTGSPTVLLLCGLQGAGKTTQSVKLARYLKRKGKVESVLVAACDLKRPAAVEQLKQLGEKGEIPVYFREGEKDPLRVAKEALQKAKNEQIDLLIVDTAGRLHLDEEMMSELEKMKKLLSPDLILYVASATTGQDAVRTAKAFDERMGITGTILTMLDASARAGAALSIREVTKKPLLFEGVGEHLDDFRSFHPESMADRILGMGDVINLVRKAEEHFDKKEEEALERKIRKAEITYDDYLKQMGSLRKMGSLKGILKMFPGASELGDLDASEEQFRHLEAMILSMTPAEREDRVEFTPSRRRRIARGSGNSVDEVNRMIKNFKNLRKMCKQLPALAKSIGR